MKKKIVTVALIVFAVAVALTVFMLAKEKDKVLVYLDGREVSVSTAKNENNEEIYISAEEVFYAAGVDYKKNDSGILAKGDKTLEINTKSNEIKVEGEQSAYEFSIKDNGIMISPYLAGEIIGGEVAKSEGEIHILKTVPVKVRFRESGKEIEFSYSDSFFVPSSAEYNHALAKLSVGAAVSAFSAKEADKNWGDEGDFGRDANVVEFYRNIGLSNIKTYNYDKSLNSKEDKVAFAIGEKTLTADNENYRLIVVSIRGGAYGNEWVSNFNLGLGEIHKGFLLSANEVSETVYDYIGDIDKNVKLWVTGFSRGGAVANIAAAKIGDDGRVKPENIYAYTFASPRVTRSDSAQKEKYGYIYNVISENDLVPLIPPEKWGYRRFGKDIKLPSLKDYEEIAAQAEAERIAKIYSEISLSGELDLTKIENSNQAEQVRATVDSICVAMQSCEDYTQNYEKIMMDFVECGNTKIKDKNGRWKWASVEEGIVNKYGSDESLKKAGEDSFLKGIGNSFGEAGKRLLGFGAVCVQHGKEPYKSIVEEIGLGNLATVASVFSPSGSDEQTISKAHYPESYIAQMLGFGNPESFKSE